MACVVENGTKPPLSWRKVNHFNKEKLPLLGFVHQSIACNHCKDAPCLNACPSKAYSFDTETGAVIHTKEHCIGCKYCTWACPFDAPKYNQKEGVIEKCHFCFHKLKDGGIPACALNCPTGALSFGKIEEMPHPDSVGFSRKEIYPRIKVVGKEVVNATPELDVNVSGIDESHKKQLAKGKGLVNPVHELPLALFTFTVALTVGWFWSGIMPGSVKLTPFIFGTLSFIAILLSVFHLGKPFRAYLSIKNAKSSWLSREILLFGLFATAGFITLNVSSIIMLYVSSLLGLLLLASIEMIYSITIKKYRTPIHSANTIATALTFAAIFSHSWSVLIVLLALKTMLFTVRNGTSEYGTRPVFAMVAFTRLVIGFLIPFGFLAFTQVQFTWWLVLLIIIGELIDRILYYVDFEPERPFGNDDRKGILNEQ